VMSFILTALSAPSIKRSYRSAVHGSAALPSVSGPGGGIILEIDPPRPRFLPGIRLSACWSLSFGPFRHRISAPLPAKGPGIAESTIPRRGEWTGHYSLRASDYFGFVVLNCSGGPPGTVYVPPKSGESVKIGMIGRSSAETASAPRIKDDAEEKYERRAYIPGDDTRRLDWKHFARSGDLLVRVGEDTIPSRGRIWLLAAVDPRTSKRHFCRLDRCLETADAMVRGLWEDNQDVMASLPGEDTWTDAATESVGTDWPKRLAAGIPTGHRKAPSPPNGERVWVVIYPGDEAGLTRAMELLRNGCRVVVGVPAALPRPELLSIWKRDGYRLTDSISAPWRRLKYQRRIAQTEAAAQKAGIDVRRI
ncbi:MAG: DUF58 domain-containing protein, partial [Spirochaetaceae bacterium]|nr:DUF58 domain-containing protein [Spirochaetaceae bacterium]